MKLTLQQMTVAQLVLATSVALLLVMIFGSLVGLVAWPFLMAVYRNANRALGIVTFALNILSVALALAVLHLGVRMCDRSRSSNFWRRNAPLLSTSSVIVVIMLIQSVLTFIGGQVRSALILNVPHTEFLTPETASWVAATGVLLPAFALVVMLWVNARRAIVP
jgi:hypothetical protein